MINDEMYYKRLVNLIADFFRGSPKKEEGDVQFIILLKIWRNMWQSRESLTEAMVIGSVEDGGTLSPQVLDFPAETLHFLLAQLRGPLRVGTRRVRSTNRPRYPP
jgi:hypothetical protein